jgi:CHAT domain-containing protein
MKYLLLMVLNILSFTYLKAQNNTVLDSLVNVSNSFYAQNKIDSAIITSEIARTYTIDHFGNKSKEYANICIQIGKNYNKKNKISESLKWYKESASIWENNDFKKDSIYFKILYSIGSLHFSSGEYQKACEYYESCLKYIEINIGKENIKYITSLNALCMAQSSAGNYLKAEKDQLESLRLLNTLKTPDRKIYALTLNGLGLVYDKLSKYTKAELAYLEEINIFENELKMTNTLDHIGALINLGICYLHQGKYDKSENILLAAKQRFLRDSSERQSISYYFECLSALGKVYKRMNNYAKAEYYLLEGLQLMESNSSNQKVRLGAALMDYASICSVQKNYTKSDTLFRKARDIFVEIGGVKHPNAIICDQNIAENYYEKKDYQKAIDHLLVSKENIEKIKLTESIYYADVLLKLSETCVRIKNERAEEYLLQSQKIYSNNKSHKNYSRFLNSSAAIYKRLGKFEESIKFYKEYLDLAKKDIVNASNFLANQELELYLNSFEKSYDQINSIASISEGKLGQSLAYDQCLFFKGFIQNSSNKLKHLIDRDTSLQDYYQQLNNVKRQISKINSKLKSNQDSLFAQKLVEETIAIEKNIYKAIPDYKTLTENKYWSDIQSALKSNQVAIEFVKYRLWQNDDTDSVYYAAILINKTDSTPHFISLFEEKELLKNMDSKSVKRFEYVSKLYGIRENNNINSNFLYNLIWQKIEPYLSNIQTVYISTAGILNQINFNNIINTKGELLMENFDIVLLQSTKSILEKEEIKNPVVKDIIMYGDIEYDMKSSSINDISNVVSTKDNDIASRGINSFYDNQMPKTAYKWNKLPGSKAEINGIKNVIKTNNAQTVSLTNDLATEKVFNSYGVSATRKLSPYVIHLSTHGYFFENSSIYQTESNEFRKSSDPMVRSGLLMSGANNAWLHNENTTNESEDGILTAYEISLLDLRNTELVVLSACETGLGEVQGNEGVYGLQRAFKIAGVKNIIMSLWQVPDQHTAELMVMFYDNWLNKKMSIRKALLAAQNSMRDKKLEPYYWAGFVLLE